MCLALAQQSCSYCQGLGKTQRRNGTERPCLCVFRAVFRACYARFRYCLQREGYLSRTQAYSTMALSHRRWTAEGRRPSGACGPATRRLAWGHPNQEYIADFCLLGRRALQDHEREYKVFQFHFLLGADWKVCTRKMGIDRGTFFHALYRVEEQLGRAFVETRPYGLFPLDEYFSGSVVGSKAVQAHGTPASDSPAAGCGPKAYAAGAGISGAAA